MRQDGSNVGPGGAALEVGVGDPYLGGLFGYHDNVRRFWEEQLTRYALGGFLADIVTRRQFALTRIRIMDFGCRLGEGYELLTSLPKRNLSPVTKEVDVLSPLMVGAYRGVDLDPDAIESVRQRYAANPKLTFDVADLNEGLPVTKGEPPYDIYFSSFGTLSYLEDDALARLVEQICDHMGATGHLVMDMLGRYSPEWPCYWDAPAPAESCRRPYRVSFLYPPSLRDADMVEAFPMRFWGGEELSAFVTEVCARKRVKIRRHVIQDRSIFVGRHMDTAEFNPHAQPIRTAVASLFEFHKRTDLQSLVVDYVPHPEHRTINTFLEHFQMAWNAVVLACIEAISNYNRPTMLAEPPSEEYPEPVRQAIATMRGVVANAPRFRMGDPLANVVEPQLAYVLRNLESDLQRGLGAAHGLLGLFELARE